MDRLTVIFLGVLLVYGCEGAKRVNLDNRLNEWRAKRMLQRSVGDEGSTPTNESPEHLLGLGKDEKLTVKDEVFNKAGHLQVKFQETYKGLPITGETVVLELDEHGQYTGVYGRLVEGLEDDIPTVEPLLVKQDVINIAVSHHKDNVNEIKINPDKDVKLEVFFEKLGEEFLGTLAYRVSYIVQTPHKLSKPIYIIDANKGTIIESWEGLSSKPYPRQGDYELVKGVGGNEKTGKYLYDGTSKFPLLKVKKTADGKCRLENEHVRVMNMNRTTNERAVTGAHEFECHEGNLDKVNGAYSPLNDVYFFSNLVTEMYLDWFGQSPFDGMITAYVHYDKDLTNAYYYANTLTFGDSTGDWHPFTSLDIVSHEIGHGVVERYSDLRYRQQSGGMNEAFADIAGAAADYYFDYTAFDVGAKIKKQCGKMRYMYDPQLDKRSIGHARMFCPSMDVHYSSGVFNKAFYLLANTDGWNVKSAFAVFYMANRLYWHEDSDFNDGACGVVKATKDAGKSADDVMKVFEQVGVDPCEEPEQQTVSIGAPVNQTLIVPLNFTGATTILSLVRAYYGNPVNVKVVTADDSVLQNRTLRSWYLSQIELNATQAASAAELHVSNDLGDSPLKAFSAFSYTPDEIRWLVRNMSLAHGEINPDNVTYIKFEIPEDFFENQPDTLHMMVIIRLITFSDDQSKFAMNFDREPIGKYSKWFDYYHFGIGRNRIIHICHPKPGTYYLGQALGNPADLLDIFYVPVYPFNKVRFDTI